jgi:hypothetical protein
MKIYDKPTEALYGSVKICKAIDDPKAVARDFIKKKLSEDMV